MRKRDERSEPISASGGLMEGEGACSKTCYWSKGVTSYRLLFELEFNIDFTYMFRSFFHLISTGFSLPFFYA